MIVHSGRRIRYASRPAFWFFDEKDVDFRNRKNQRSMNRTLTMIIEICGNGGRYCIFCHLSESPLE